MEGLRRLRLQKGYSQRQLSARSGIDQGSISDIEAGKRSPSVVTLERLAQAMDSEVADLFPKAQASLFEEEDEQRRVDPFLVGLMSSLDLWAERQENALSEGDFGGEGCPATDAEPALQLLWKNERVQHEAALLSRTVEDAMGYIAIQEKKARPGMRGEEVARELVAKRKDLWPIVAALGHVARAADRWEARAEVAWDDADGEVERRWFAARARRAAQDSDRDPGVAAELEKRARVAVEGSMEAAAEAEGSGNERIGQILEMFRERQSA